MCVMMEVVSRVELNLLIFAREKFWDRCLIDVIGAWDV